jgi:hypothetical protein
MIPKSGYRLFGKDHAQTTSWSAMTIRGKVIPLQPEVLEAPSGGRRCGNCDSRKGPRMRLYIFKSETTNDLRAFAGNPDGSKLPPNHGPWTVVGVVGVDKAPPHNFSRTAIEKAIDGKGFQLWRFIKKAEAQA